MERRNGHKVTLWTILILVILNLALVGVLWYEHGKRPAYQPENVPTFNKQEMDKRFARELQLDEQQADSVIVLREIHFQTRDSLSSEITRLSRQIIDELFVTKPDTALVRELSRRIGQHQAALEKEVYDHFDLIKQLCRPSQQEMLKRLILDAMRSKRPSSHGGPSAPPPPPGASDEHRPPPGGPGNPPPGR